MSGPTAAPAPHGLPGTGTLLTGTVHGPVQDDVERHRL
jgi:hypothetical protein